MHRLPKIGDIQKEDYLRLKNDVDKLPEPIRKLIIDLFIEIERLHEKIDEQKDNVCAKCKYFDS